MQSHRVIAITLLAMALGSGPSLAQSPEPVTQQLCVTFAHAPGTVITPSTLASELAAGTVTVMVVESSEGCLGRGTGNALPVEAVSDMDAYTAFLGHGVTAEDRFNTLKSKVTDAIDNDASSGTVAKRATAVADFLKTEVAWLDDNPPSDCYAVVWQGYRDSWAMFRKSFVDFAYGERHTSLSRMNRAVDEINEANDLYDAIDFDTVTCTY